MNTSGPVLVVGDGMIDRYWLGETSTISAEVPVPIVKIREVLNLPGGANNVVAGLEALGVEVEAAVSQGPVKNRLMVGDHQLARWDENDVCEEVGGWLDFWSARLFEDIRPVAVVVADYGKGAVTPQAVRRLADMKLPAFVDTKRPSLYVGEFDEITFFPNEVEFKAHSVLYGGLVVRKEGPRGISYNGYHVPARARFVRSVNGAGDTVLAAWVAKWLEGGDPKECLEFAADAAALAVERPYTSVVTREEICRTRG